MNNQRYNHHSGQYLPTTSSTGGSSSSTGGSSSNSGGASGSNRWGQRYTSEFGGGNNARHGQTSEASIKIDLLMAVTSSWMGEDVEFAKRWIEIVEKFPNKLKDATEMIEKAEELGLKKKIEGFLKKEYPGETNSSTNSGKGGNPDMKTSENMSTKFDGKVTKYKKGTVLHTDVGNVTVTSDSTRDYTPQKSATDTVQWLKKNNY